jgi:hypothetical protein
MGRTSFNLFTIVETYASGDLVLQYETGYQRGQVNTGLAQNMAREVQCFGDACQGDEAIGRTSGNTFRLVHLFENGRAQVEFLSGYQRGQLSTADLANLSVRVRARPGRPGHGGGVIVTPPPAREGTSCRFTACQVGLACIDGCPPGARCNPVPARGIDRVLACPR